MSLPNCLPFCYSHHSLETEFQQWLRTSLCCAKNRGRFLEIKNKHTGHTKVDSTWGKKKGEQHSKRQKYNAHWCQHKQKPNNISKSRDSLHLGIMLRCLKPFYVLLKLECKQATDQLTSCHIVDLFWETTDMTDLRCWRTTYSWQVPYFNQCHWTCHQRSPVLGDYISMANGGGLSRQVPLYKVLNWGSLILNYVWRFWPR